MRADLALANSLNISRNKASELIKARKVSLNGAIIDKPSLEVDEPNFSVDETIYVSRAALKLKGFLSGLEYDFSGLNALDIGSSTGGFVQILLENGVKSVTALDVGTAQLSSNLRDDKRIIIQENTDIREFKAGKFDLISVDVSFISVVQILEHIDKLAKKDIIILFKPQFEVGKNAKRNSKGVVKDTKQIKLVMAKFESACTSFGWELKASKESVIPGKEGNLEIFYYYTKK
ncbi:16S/23S rRNA (cytidine-2'-O)-methyltransferase [Campylobacter iguaniorum]|uniref:23S rRNA (cytidine-2'-O)-methyltransferase TlyA n=1 Tax=Campylobacter iguaniorum TaxID=1244531 RepID=UPI000739FF1B|nr:TlyA family RNA methyltransferase [Campylobacter iguaniorum]ALV24818.1 16S/23S rRNA (cytidine-2'-O)-methyltransferase [Campylobacter iguaniorum]